MQKRRTGAGPAVSGSGGSGGSGGGAGMKKSPGGTLQPYAESACGANAMADNDSQSGEPPSANRSARKSACLPACLPAIEKLCSSSSATEASAAPSTPKRAPLS